MKIYNKSKINSDQLPRPISQGGIWTVIQTLFFYKGLPLTKSVLLAVQIKEATATMQTSFQIVVV